MFKSSIWFSPEIPSKKKEKTRKNQVLVGTNRWVQFGGRGGGGGGGGGGVGGG